MNEGMKEPIRLNEHLQNPMEHNGKSVKERVIQVNETQSELNQMNE